MAGSWDFDNGVHADTKLTLSYGLGIRTGKPSDALINGPVDPLQLQLTQQAYQNHQAFGHTGLPITINTDDGDRNFNQFSLINNRVSALGELHVTYQNYGLVLSGDTFYDQVYHHPNDNSSPELGTATDANNPSTVNKTGSPTRFTDGARYYDGSRSRLLEAYAYGDWYFGTQTSLDVRLGSQLVAWGESLFFSGIALAQSRADATKAAIPGVEVKELLLPTNQLAVNMSVTNNLTLLGYYKLAYRPTEVFPNGDYFSPADVIGPGATFAYGSINPLYLNGCPGLIPSNLIAQYPALGTVCNLHGVGGRLFDAPPYILTTRAQDIRPSSFGQWGLGLRYQVTERTNVGAYWLRYHDTNPTVNLNVGYAYFATPGGRLYNLVSTLLPSPTSPVAGLSMAQYLLSTAVVNEPVPVTYNVKYWDGIDMAALSYSTILGPLNVAGEFSYRMHQDMPVQSQSLGVLTPIYTRGSVAQALLSAVYATNLGMFYDDFNFVTELGYIHAGDVDPVENPSVAFAQPGGSFGPLDKLFYSRNSWAMEFLALPTKRNIISGWDLTTPISFARLMGGNPEMAGAFGSLTGQGDTRLGISASMQYLQNLQFSLGYNFFFGDPNKFIGNSTLKANYYADRDYLTFSIKYNL